MASLHSLSAKPSSVQSLTIVQRSTALITALLLANCAEAQLRIATYNTAEDATGDLATVLEAIGEWSNSGFSKPIDILSLQEQTSLTTTTQAIVDQLNAIYGEGTYARGLRSASSSGAGRPAVVYNTQSVELLEEQIASNVGESGGARGTLRYKFRPIGYDETSDFYLFGSHFKASTGSTNEQRRNVEATEIRVSADSLGEGASILYTGDFNLYSSSEPAYQTLLGSGPGQAMDPLNPNNNTQNWDNNSYYASFHTQSPCTSSTGNCGVGSGMDSRFDFQLMSSEVLDGEGFSLISGSYQAFGNNGSTYNTNINSSANTVSFPGVTSFSKSQVLSALQRATDHIPVVADYQLPAVLDAVVDTIPTELQLGESFSLDIAAFNAADVLIDTGADELDFTLETTGDLAGTSLSGTDDALGSGVLLSVPLDTATAGVKSGSIVLSTSSQSAANPTITIPVTYEVLAPILEGDYNNDGLVDAADYTVWRDGGPLLNETQTIGSVDEADYGVWKDHYGAGSSPSLAIPEPLSRTCASLLVLLGLAADRNIVRSSRRR